MTAVLDALSADSGASVTELSGRAKLGRSTTSRMLTALEGMGLARRERPDRSTDHSSPDLWFTATEGQADPATRNDAPADREQEPDAQPSDTAPDAKCDDPQPTENEETEPANTLDDEDPGQPNPPHNQTEPEAATGGETLDGQIEPDGNPSDPELTADAEPGAAAAATDPASEQQSQAQPAADGGAEPDAPGTPETGSGTEAAGTGHGSPAAPGETGTTVRLGKGELRALVVEHLRAHPNEEFTASQIGKALNKSSGAVANNFDVLVKTGEAEMTCEKPRRFRYLAKAAN
jgi:hypothetical protein